MTPPPAPSTKKRKLNKTENLARDKKRLKKSFCKGGDDRKKVLERARDQLQDVTVTFYCAGEVDLLDKKVREFKDDWRDHKQGNRIMLQTCHGIIQKGKEDMTKAPHASHHDNLKQSPKHSSYRRSSLLKFQNLRDLLPRSQFHSVKKRTPFSCKIDHIRNDTSLYSPNGNDSEPELGAAVNRDTYLAVPVSVGAVQRGGSFPLISQILERQAAESDIFPSLVGQRKHSEKRTHSVAFKGSLIDGDLKARGKFTRAYVRKKYRVPFFKDESPDLYALHLLADTSLNLVPDPNFQVQVHEQKGASLQGFIEHGPLSTNSKSHEPKVYAEGNDGLTLTSKTASVHQKALQSDEVSLNGHVSPAVDLLMCTSVYEKQNLNQNINKEISRDDINIDSHINEFQLTEEVAANVNQKTMEAENELIDCHYSMCTPPPTLEDKQTKESNVKDATKASSAASKKDAFLSEHRERVDETVVEKDDIDLKRDSKCFRGPYSVFSSKDFICYDKISSSWRQLEPCNTYPGNSESTLRCMETPQKSEACPSSSSTKTSFDGSPENLQKTKGCPSYFNANNLINSSSGYHVREIVQSSKHKAIRMVDLALKAMSSMKVGQDAYTMIGEALDSEGIQQFGVPSKIARMQQCFNPQNWGPGNCHHDLLCNSVEVAATVHSISSTVPTLPRNGCQIPPKLISACVAALLMIQASSDARLPPAEAMEILEHAARDLRPQHSQNLHIYSEIEDLLGIIKTQILSMVRTPASNFHL